MEKQSPQSLLEQIPGYREAVEKEREQRESPFSCLPEILCGIEVLPLSVWHMVILSGVKSPFIFGLDATITQAEQFLWIVSPQYRAALWLKNWLSPWFPKLAASILARKKRAFAKVARRIQMSDEDIISAIEMFVADCFRECASGDGDSFNPSYFCAPAAIVAELASNLHFTRPTILNLSIKEVFQYQRWLKGQRDPKSLFLLVNESDRVRSKWLAEQSN